MTNSIMDEVRQRYMTPEVKRQVELQVMVANRIYDLLEEKGMTQKDLALKLGKTEQEVSRWLCGTHNLTMATIAKIAVALDDDLLVATQSKKRKKISLKLPTMNKAAVL